MTLDELKHALATDHDLRALLGNLIISSLTGAVTGNHDYRAGEGGLIQSATAAAIVEAGVLTEATVHASPGLYARIEESVYEVLNKNGLIPPKGPTP